MKTFRDSQAIQYIYNSLSNVILMSFKCGMLKYLNSKGVGMRKITAIVLSGTAAFFLSACGGGSSDSTYIPVAPVPVDPMTERDLITIFYHTPDGMCEDVEFQDYVKEGLAAEGYVVDYYLFREETNDVNCATYDRTNEITETGGCVTTDLILQDPSFSAYDTSCVIGVDIDINAQPTTKYTEETLKTGTQGTDIVSNMKSAIQGW